MTLRQRESIGIIALANPRSRQGARCGDVYRSNPLDYARHKHLFLLASRAAFCAKGERLQCHFDPSGDCEG